MSADRIKALRALIRSNTDKIARRQRRIRFMEQEIDQLHWSTRSAQTELLELGAVRRPHRRPK